MRRIQFILEIYVHRQKKDENKKNLTAPPSSTAVTVFFLPKNY